MLYYTRRRRGAGGDRRGHGRHRAVLRRARGRAEALLLATDEIGTPDPD